MWWFILLSTTFIHGCTSEFLYSEIKVTSYEIVGIFDKSAKIQQQAFNESMRNVHQGEYQVDPIILQPSRTDSYSVWRDMCSNEMRPIAVIGPQNPVTDSAIRNQCAIANIPHIQATWQHEDPAVEQYDTSLEPENIEDDLDFEFEEDQEEEAPEEEELTFKKISINFFPHPDEISIAYAKLLKFYGWDSFSVLYEDDDGLLRIQKILSEHSKKHEIFVRRLDPNSNNHKIFKELSSYPESRILLDCHVDNILKYLDEAAELNMVDYYQHYILVSMDAATIADNLVQLQCNTTWLSLTEYDKLEDSQHFLVPRVGKWNHPMPAYAVTQFELESLIMDDIANHIVQSIEKIRRPRNSICDKDAMPWEYGAKLQNQILKTKTVGVTGNIQFDERGRRINYILHVNEINVKKRHTIGTWKSENGSEIIASQNYYNEAIAKQQTSKVFRIIFRKNKPYFYDKKECVGDNCEPDDDPDMKYEGFAVDLVKNIFQILQEEGFNYTYVFINQTDETYGKYDKKTKKWNGLIGYLLDKKADLAVCDFTITEERKKVVDFSVPFMTLGISILFLQEYKITPGLFSFLNPYTFDVWMHIATAYCVVSIVLYICARISPADWENPEPGNMDPEELENTWSFKNCVWLTMGSIMTQGCDILPKAIGTRWVCGMWWFFAVIVCQTYIAQLSASMTSALEEEPINSVEDLAKQTKILYGAYKDGSTLEFFRSSKDKMYRQMYDTMISNPVVLVDSNDEGERRVLKGNNKYAFFMESSTIEYKLKRNCRLKKVGAELDSKDYGIAMPANSPFRSQINSAILRLKEHTILDEIKRKWWEEKYGATNCETKTNDNDVEGDLEMENLEGAFIVLIGGLVLSLFITAAEFMNEVRNIVVAEHLTHKEALIQELRSSLNFFQLKKPVRNVPEETTDTSSEKKEKMDKKSAFTTNFIDMEKENQ